MEDVVLAMDAGREVESIYRTVYQSDGNEIYLLDMIKEGQQAKSWNESGTGKQTGEEGSHTDEGMYELRGNRTKVLEKIRRYIMKEGMDAGNSM